MQAQTVNYTITESTGLLGTQDKGSFGNGMYRHTKRSELTALLKTVQQSNWIAMRPLVKNYLLTEADASALIQDIPVTPGEDLLTSRINALIRMGYLREASELYRKASDNTLDEATILNGIYAMLLTRQKGLACLEVKTVIQRFADIPLWKTLNSYCETSLPGGETQTDESYEYDPKGFASLSMLERATLSAQGKITTQYIAPQTISEIPPQDISVLLAQPGITDLQKALLLGAAVDYAIEPPEVIASFYEEILANEKSTTEDLFTLAGLYKETTEKWIVTQRAEKISQAITLARMYSDNLLIPFLPVISKLDINKEITLEDASSLITLYLHAPENISQAWIKDLLKTDFSDQPRKEIARENLLTALFLINKKEENTLNDKVHEYLSSATLISNSVKDVKNIIENIDSTLPKSDKVRIENVNGFDLAADKRYKMPPYRVLSTLKQASKNQDISVSLLLSAYLLSSTDKQDTYIGTLGDVASALSDVGVKTTPCRIIAQALMLADEEKRNEN